MKNPAAGGGRWVEVPPERLVSWIVTFAERHGGPGPVTRAGDGATVTFAAADGATAECHPPFPPLPVLGQASLAGPGEVAGAAEDRPHALVRYMESLRETREMPARLVLGGHGPPVTEHATLIDERFRMTTRRAGKIHRLLESGPQTAYDLASQMWGNVAVTQAFLTISEVLGHLDLLIADGRAAEDDSGPVTLFSAVDP